MQLNNEIFLTEGAGAALAKDVLLFDVSKQITSLCSIFNWWDLENEVVSSWFLCVRMMTNQAKKV